MSIPETRLKIKPLGILILKITSIILILGLVFTLGRISTLSKASLPEPIQIIYPPLVTPAPQPYRESGNSNEPESWAFAGSKTGKTYYPKGCPGLGRVKPENRVYFTTSLQAEQAGYHLSATCQ